MLWNLGTFIAGYAVLFVAYSTLTAARSTAASLTAAELVGKRARHFRVYEETEAPGIRPAPRELVGGRAVRSSTCHLSLSRFYH